MLESEGSLVRPPTSQDPQRLLIQDFSETTNSRYLRSWFLRLWDLSDWCGYGPLT